MLTIIPLFYILFNSLYYSTDMKLIFTLGNPEQQYDHTRHNAGFWVADNLAKEYDASWKNKSKFKCLLIEMKQDNEKVLLAKPTTYYNLVGESLRSLMNFYEIPSKDVLIIHDDLALPLGVIRTRAGGSDAGNNGIKSVNNYGGRDPYRMRIGIAADTRTIMGDADFVLGKFDTNEQDILTGQLAKIKLTVEQFLDNKLQTATHRI